MPEVSMESLPKFEVSQILLDREHFLAGCGGFASVLIGYLNGDPSKPVAIKVFAVVGGIKTKDDVLKAVKEEAEHLQKVWHDNIVRVHGWVEWGFSIGIVMEFCKGGNLKELLLDKSITLGLPLLVRILRNIADALTACHGLLSRRLIHVDLKPENILLTENIVAKLTDFGAAELATITASRLSDHLTKKKKDQPQFTLFYCAPEKLKKLSMKPTVGLDVYSFALIIHMVLTRELPYPACDMNTFINAVQQGKRPACEVINELKSTLSDPNIVEVLEKLMKKCWAHDPSERPKMADIRDKLKKLLDQQQSAQIQQQENQAVANMSMLSTNPNPQVRIDRFSVRTGTLIDGEPTTPGDFPRGVQQSSNLGGRVLQASSMPPMVGRVVHDHSPEIKMSPSSSSQFSGKVDEQGEESMLGAGPSTSTTDTTINQLLEKYVGFLERKQHNRSKSEKEELVALFRDLGATSTIPKHMADRFASEGKFLRAVALYQVADAFE